MMKKCAITWCLAISFCLLKAQTKRITDNNTIGWLSNTTTLKINNKWSIHAEYQWRRANFLTDWQQSLFRSGVNYQWTDKVQLRLGFALVKNFPYGDYPLQAAGKPFSEKRLFEAITINDKISDVSMVHRFVLEQRWTDRYSNPFLSNADDVSFTNRIRYMVRLQKPIGKKELNNRTPYVAMYDELFTSFGRNVGENIFDQNRLGILLGYKFNPLLRIEAGYLNQILQLSREVNDNNIFQHNHGIILNTYLNIGK